MALIFANLSALKAGIISWLAEGNPDGETLDRAIALVEADMRRKIRVFQTEVSTTLSITVEDLTVPSRFLAARLLQIPGSRAMSYLSPELLASHQADNPASAQPLKYTLVGREDGLPFFRFSPIPDATYSLRLTYMADPALISDEDCNAILDNYPDIYFYGALTHLADYVRNKERLPDWQSRYDAAIESLREADLRDKVDGSAIHPRSVYRGG